MNPLIGGQGDWTSWILGVLLFMVFFAFYPRVMLTQIVWKLEGTAKRMELMTSKTRDFLGTQIEKKPSKKTKEEIARFMEFFAIGPVELDPYGIVRKFDHLITNERARFSYFVRQIAPKIGAEKAANIEMGLAGGIQVNFIAKVVRHYLELIKKTKSYQIAMILQMQMPLIERMAKAMFKGTRALAKGEPIGDSIGPYITATLIGDSKVRIQDDMAVAEKRIEGRKAILLKATGPGGRTGYPGKAVGSIAKKKKPARIITIDAAAKLEGEATGSVAEGVGVAMGGVGVERSYIEDAGVKSNIPIDSIIVKMGTEEAIMPMRKKIVDATEDAVASVRRSIKMTRRGDTVMIIGVGNTSGVGNNAAEAAKMKKWVESYERRLKKKTKKKRLRR